MEDTVPGRAARIGVGAIALLTAWLGLLELGSVVAPVLPERLQWPAVLLPVGWRHGSRLFTAVSAFFFFQLAANLLRRKWLAWLVTLILLALSLLNQLLSGRVGGNTLLACGLIGLLLAMRSSFTARSDRPSLLQGCRVALAALLFILVYGTLGFFLLDRHYAVSFSLPGAALQTLSMFLTLNEGGLEPVTGYGRFFADSIDIVGAITLVYAAVMLFRPVIFRDEASDQDRRHARTLVERHGRSSLARIALLPDKWFWFSPSGESVIAYTVRGRGAVALGDPIGPRSDLRDALQGFLAFCERNDWVPAFYQVLPESLSQYESLGWHALKIGEEGVVSLSGFTLKGKAGRDLRPSVNKLTSLGYRVVLESPPIRAELLNQLRGISDEWLRHLQATEKRFSVGWFDESYLRECEIAVLEDRNHTAVAFANLVPEYRKNEITIDLMRQRTGVEHGTMDFLFVSLLEECRTRGYESFNLGLAALSGVGDDSKGSSIEEVIDYLYHHLNRIYHFQGLRAYKEKFQPHWQSRYLVYRRLADLPEIVLALVRADTNDHLVDLVGARFLSTALQRLLHRLQRLAPLLLSLALFVLAAWALNSQLRGISLNDVIASVGRIPIWGLVAAVILTAVNYLFLTAYDALAVRYVGVAVPYRRAALVAVISYAISNSIGMALLSGGSIRLRFYSLWGLGAGTIARIIAFCNLSFWVGLLAVGGIVFSLEPLAVPPLLRLPVRTAHPIGLLFLLLVGLYLVGTALQRGSLRLGRWELPRLPLSLSLAQIGITSCDWTLAAGVLYCLLLPAAQLPFPVFLGSYLLAQMAGILSNVPGGLGVFESVLLLLLGSVTSPERLVGALLVYRLIYYLAPLLVGVGLLISFEFNRGRRADPLSP
ncbi:phosphatidylglycerol lysyltransferase domain-containing protein [Synechococcus sp. GFB01]|uniref:phosphatidylglycerol lysyltransferase domain-containing protein n=1 Tax=Synechococcus sp. GFB01 TaxID=1662190 RepID=UPI001910C05F|nr:phosphatidylglycerol lysyltransferase domain-containing protein [Synechococcus sp. GFB01]